MHKFDEFEVHADTRSFWAGPGVLSEPLNRALYEQGFVFPSAHTGFVTIGGFLLGGGMGWNMPAYGMACGSILAIECLLADGRTVVATEKEHSDLFWAARGVGPGFFATILRYQLRLYPAPAVIKNTFFIPLERVEQGVAEVIKLLPASNNRTEVLGALGRFSPPGTPPGKEAWHWVLNLMSFGQTQVEALAAARVFTESPLAQLATAHPATNVELKFPELYSQLATDAYSTYRTTEAAIFTEQPGKVLRQVGELLSRKALDQRSFGFSVLGTNPTVPEPCSFTYSAPHYVSWYLIGTTNEEVKANYQLLDALQDTLAPLIKGYYINEIDLLYQPELAQRCFAAEKWQRLQEVRRRYDPQQRYVSYLNDPPASSHGA